MMVGINMAPVRHHHSPIAIRRHRRRHHGNVCRCTSSRIVGVGLAAVATLLALCGVWLWHGTSDTARIQRSTTTTIHHTSSHHDNHDRDVHDTEYNASPHLQLRTHVKDQHHQETSKQSQPQQHHLQQHDGDVYDVIVVGSGLAGLTTTLQVLDRGGKVALVEKEGTLGGNSLKASSGMNACCHDDHDTTTTTTSTTTTKNHHDTVMAFELDTTESAGTLANPTLIHELVTSSFDALQWLQDRVGVDLSQIAQLGGHSFPRTHRPAQGMVGAELIVHLQQIIQSFDDEKGVTILTHSKVTQLLYDTNQQTITGVQIQNTHTNTTQTIVAPQVVLATGGFASDRNPHSSLLAKVRPDLIAFGTTGGTFSTGDGIVLATQVGAHTIDLSEIQLHPTGFVSPPQMTTNGTKVLAAELLRGVGGILMNRFTGERFCNELGTRDYVTKQMLAQASSSSNSNDNDKDQQRIFALVLTEQAAQKADRHVELYHRKGLLTKLQGVQALAQWISSSTTTSTTTSNPITADVVLHTFQTYQSAAATGMDAFGKTVFPGFPAASPQLDWEEQEFYVGLVTPVLHYCMGGVEIDVEGRVLNEQGSIIEGLYAAGEVAGGVHGKNRLGGNSLLECTVFGRRIGQSLTLRHGRPVPRTINDIPAKHRPHSTAENRIDPSLLSVDAVVSAEDLRQHSSGSDLWMAIHGLVYNLTEFSQQHPGGAAILESLAGSDATRAFDTVHSKQLLEQFHAPGQSVVVGHFTAPAIDESSPPRTISLAELKQHATPDDCWVVFHGMVYDMTEFSKTHKGGAYLIQKYAGRDATDTFRVFHKKEKLELVANLRVGILEGAES